MVCHFIERRIFGKMTSDQHAVGDDLPNGRKGEKWYGVY